MSSARYLCCTSLSLLLSHLKEICYHIFGRNKNCFIAFALYCFLGNALSTHVAWKIWYDFFSPLLKMLWSMKREIYLRTNILSACEAGEGETKHNKEKRPQKRQTPCRKDHISLFKCTEINSMKNANLSLQSCRSSSCSFWLPHKPIRLHSRSNANKPLETLFESLHSDSHKRLDVYLYLLGSVCSKAARNETMKFIIMILNRQIIS